MRKQHKIFVILFALLFSLLVGNEIYKKYKEDQNWLVWLSTHGCEVTFTQPSIVTWRCIDSANFVTTHIRNSSIFVSQETEDRAKHAGVVYVAEVTSNRFLKDDIK